MIVANSLNNIMFFFFLVEVNRIEKNKNKTGKLQCILSMKERKYIFYIK